MLRALKILECHMNLDGRRGECVLLGCNGVRVLIIVFRWKGVHCFVKCIKCLALLR